MSHEYILYDNASCKQMEKNKVTITLFTNRTLTEKILAEPN